MPFAPLDENLSPPSQELRHFTNRVSELEAFRRALAIPAGQDVPAIMFYGVGGTGKSWVLKRLQQSLDGSLPCAYLDLDHSNPGGAACHTDWSRALAEIRRQLGADVFCPRFDLAYAFIRYKEGAGDEPLFRGAGILGHVWEFLVEVGDSALSSVPGGNLLTWAINKVTSPLARKVQASPLGHWLETQLGEEDFRKLKPLLADEIYLQLHHRLLLDLRENLPASDRACRAVVFIDTLEALRAPRDSAEELARVQEWVRNLYHPSSGVLLVMAGRDRLTWERIEPAFADPQYLDQHLVGGLSQADALRFLRSCSVADPALQQAVLRVACDVETRTIPQDEAADQATGGDAATGEHEASYHPFSLGLAADTIAAAQRSGQPIDAASFDMQPGDIRRLAARFLRSLGTDGSYSVWLRRLALTPRFDEAAARMAFSSHAGSEQDAAWNALREYSFFQPAGNQNDGWWTLHGRMREALAESRDDEVEAAEHRWWNAYWTNRSENDLDAYAALAWYHRWCLEPEEAITVWGGLCQRERNALRMGNHYQLLSWLDPCGILDMSGYRATSISTADALISLSAQYQKATVGQREACYRRAVACCEGALAVFTEERFPYAWAQVQINLGAAYESLRLWDGKASIHRAIDCYRAALRVFTEDQTGHDWAGVHTNLGNAYGALITDDGGNYLQEAIASYEAALRVWTEQDTPQEWATVQFNLATTYLRLPERACVPYGQQAISHFEAALRVWTEHAFPLEWANVHVNLGVLHNKLRELEPADNLDRVVGHYQAALRVLTAEVSPLDWAQVQLNLSGVLLQHLPGDQADALQRAISHATAALSVYTETQFRSSWAQAQYNLGAAYFQFEANRGGQNYAKAMAHFQAALRVYTPEERPHNWAKTTLALGLTMWCTAHYSGPEQSSQDLSAPEWWHRAQHNLQAATEKFRELGDEENYRISLESLEKLSKEAPPAV